MRSRYLQTFTIANQRPHQLASQQVLRIRHPPETEFIQRIRWKFFSSVITTHVLMITIMLKTTVAAKCQVANIRVKWRRGEEQNCCQIRSEHKILCSTADVTACAFRRWNNYSSLSFVFMAAGIPSGLWRRNSLVNWRRHASAIRDLWMVGWLVLGVTQEIGSLCLCSMMICCREFEKTPAQSPYDSCLYMSLCVDFDVHVDVSMLTSNHTMVI